MNKYQETLDHIINCDREDKGISYLSDAYRNDISTLRELVDRATPQKLNMIRIKKYDGYNLGICQCGQAIEEYMIDNGVKYCPNCGQVLDWSE